MPYWRSETVRLKMFGRLARAEAGSALAEMAIIVPVMILLLIGLIELGRYAQYSIVVGNAAHAGVQYGAQTLGTAANQAGMEAAARNDAGIPGVNAHAKSFCQCADGTPANCASATDCASTHRLVFVQVDTDGTFTSIVHFPGVPQSQTITSTAIMRVAQ
jgi:Flp pilus assembly protein TadG